MFWGFILYKENFEPKLAIFMILEKFSSLQMAQYWKDNLTHWSLPNVYLLGFDLSIQIEIHHKSSDSNHDPASFKGSVNIVSMQGLSLCYLPTAKFRHSVSRVWDLKAATTLATIMSTTG